MSTPDTGAETPTGFNSDDLASALDSATTTQDTGTTATAPAGETSSGEQNADQSPLEAPKHWDDRFKAQFGKVPREVQSLWLEWDKTQARSYDTKFQELAGFRREREQLDEMFQPYMRDLELAGVSRQQFVGSLLAGHRYLQESPREALLWLAQQYGVDPAALTQTPQDADPKLAGLMSEVAGLKQQLTGFTSSQQQQQHAAKVDQVRSFAEAKGADGKPLRPYFNELKSDILTFVRAGVTDLEQAYDMALHRNKEVYARHQAEQAAAQKKADDAKRQADIDRARRAAAGNESRSTGSAGEKSLDAELRDAFASWAT